MYCKVVFDVPLDRDFDYAVPPEWEAQAKPGVRVNAPFGLRLTTGLITEISDRTDLPENVLIKEIACVVDEQPVFGSDLFALARFMKARWGGPIGQILFALVPPQPYFKLESSATAGDFAPTPPNYPLTVCQQNTLQTLRALTPYEFHPVLLTGPVFSGKTETALRLAEDALKGYGQALITVPDVIAAQQFIREAENRFGADRVFCWHSKMLLSRKKKYFSAVSNGLPCLVISTRSGALLPFKNLRLAVVLNEEDENYKQEENKPYYHLRDILLFRGSLHGSTVLFLSATPSLDLMKLVKENRVTLIQMDEPVPGRAFAAQVKVAEKKGDKSKLFSDFLLTELQENLEKKQVSLLLLNRRGYSNAYFCLNCGAYARCKKCGAILSRENTKEGGDYLLCKKCGHKEGLDQECPKCHNLIFKSRGGGTQKVVTELTKLFPRARVLRLDSDTLKTKDGQGHAVADALAKRQVDIIVGTRLAANALSPQITLAAVLDADLELDSPDFRASEKFGQMLFDLKGHLSGVFGGRLIVQAADKEIYNFENLVSGTYALAAEEELAFRQSFGYPPYVRLIKVLVKSKESVVLNAETAAVKKLGAPLSAEVLGPVYCAKKTDTLKKQYLLFKTDEGRFSDLLFALDRHTPAKKAALKITADPYDFY